MGWTGEQQKVIDKRNCSILVSAAAGSGKTAVLVERILQKITDKDAPADIDEFLIVTFTRAAAAQMRDKIAGKLEKLLEEHPEDEHLNKQLVLIHRADITTIDSFCMRVVKEYFSVLDLDAGFSIGDEGMMALLRTDAIDRLFEKKYGDAEFEKLLDIFGSAARDDGLRNVVEKIYFMASSFPRPLVWLQSAKDVFDVKSPDSLLESAWVQKYIEVAESFIRDFVEQTRLALTICDLPGGPDKYEPALLSDLEQYEEILEEKSIISKLALIQGFKYASLKVCKGDSYAEELKNEVKTKREDCKKGFAKLKVIPDDMDELMEQTHNQGDYIVPLVELVEAFIREFDELKRQRHLVDFSDVEHMAYQLVCSGYDENGIAIPTDIGAEISKRYREIFIDEYQDSNYLQEDILTACSGIPSGNYNMFMVGDVKQSIYRFRMARPDLFISKYNRFAPIDIENDTGEENEIVIELKNNFRSRACVLEAANYFFYQLMHEDLGRVNYTRNIALVPTAQFAEPSGEEKDRISTNTEIMLIDYSDDGDAVDEDDADNEGEKPDKLELEAAMIAKRIRELVGNMPVQDESGHYRLAEYKDIVILARSPKGFGETVYNGLVAAGIPVHIDNGGGYFEAVEIKLLMALLSVIDNSRQDIPLTAVLLSPIGRLDENELAGVCSSEEILNTKGLSMWDKCLLYIESADESDRIKQKLDELVGIIEELKEDRMYMSIRELLWKALDITGYYIYAMSMPGGERRKANIDMLLEKAEEYEAGYYKGLFNFLRYVDRLKLSEQDFGEVEINENENVVQIMSMHKSKGLEFSIVFVSGLGKQFNREDIKDILIAHNDYYLSGMQIFPEKRYKKASAMRDVFKLSLMSENMAEELRIFYVALTRAKEKLILTGCENDVQKLREKLAYIDSLETTVLPYGVRQNANSYMQWVMAAMVRYDKLIKKLDLPDVIKMYEYNWRDISTELISQEVKRSMDMEAFLARTKAEGEEIKNSEVYKSRKRDFEYAYPYRTATHTKSKLPISEIKRMKQFDGSTYEVSESRVPEVMPDTAQKDKKGTGITGATYGTIVHKFMELLDFSCFEGLKSSDYLGAVEAAKTKHLENGVFTEEEGARINSKMITKMLCSRLGQRMIQADKRGELYKEQPFSAGFGIGEIYEQPEKCDESDIIIVQGIMDAFFYEDGKIVLMDYKTDRNDACELIKKYRSQLDYYGMTLERLTGCEVIEKIIYSFYLGEEIEV